MGPLASLKGVHGTTKLGIPQEFCNPEGKAVWGQNERRSLRSSGKTEEVTLDQPRRVISYVSQRGQRQSPQSWSHSCNQPKGVSSVEKVTKPGPVPTAAAWAASLQKEQGQLSPSLLSLHPITMETSIQHRIQINGRQFCLPVIH